MERSGRARPALDHAEAIALLTVGLDCHVEWVTWLAALPDAVRHQRTAETLAWHAMWIGIYRDVIEVLKTLQPTAHEPSSVDLSTLATRYLGGDFPDDRGGVDAYLPCLSEREQAREFMCREPFEETRKIVNA